MITLAVSALFVVVLAWWWVRWQHNFPALALRYMCAGPFLPLVSLLNHNIDADRFGAFVRTAPIYTAVLLLGISAARWRELILGVEGLFLAAYIAWSLVQIPLSSEPLWALCAWSFSAPGYLLFLMAGRASSLGALRAQRVRLAATAIAFVGIQVSLIAYGLFIGRATDLVQTRNFGSVWAGNTSLAFLALFGGLAWVAIRDSASLSYAFLVASAISMALTLSRTALLVLGIYLAFVFSPSAISRRRTLLAAVAVAITLWGAFTLLRQDLQLDAQLVDNWMVRFRDGDVLGAVAAAREARSEEFREYVDHVRTSNPLAGTGFGTFRSYSIYSDAHSLLLTEAFENSLLSAVLLLGAFGLPRTVRSLANPVVRPLALSIVGFLLLAEVTGGMLSYRSFDNYYATYPGWILFFTIGILARERTARRRSIALVPAEGERAVEARPAVAT